MKKFMAMTMAMTMAMVMAAMALTGCGSSMRQMIRQVEIFPLSASISMDSTHLWITVERAFCRVWRKQV